MSSHELIDRSGVPQSIPTEDWQYVYSDELPPGFRAEEYGDIFRRLMHRGQNGFHQVAIDKIDLLSPDQLIEIANFHVSQGCATKPMSSVE